MEENQKDYYTKAIDEAKEWEDFYNKAVEELQTEERYKNYFSQFAPDSIKQFIRFYALQKAKWYRYGDSNHEWEKKKNLKWYELAQNFIVAIQRKKVIELVIRWANYELDIPGMRSYFDLNRWVCNPFLCPLIESVQEHEIHTAIRFIHSLHDERLEYVELESFNIRKLSYIADKEHKIESDTYCLFYRYWDEEYGREHLMQDVPRRITKERDYAELGREHRNGPQPAPKPVAGLQKPALAYWDKKVTEAFVAACETAEFKRVYKRQKWWNNRINFSELAERELDSLSGSPRHLPVESHDDWREAIVHTSELYIRQQVSECLPQVYKNYLKRLETGDDFAPWVKQKEDVTTTPWYTRYLENILEGRKLMNEPADFNF